VATVALAQVKGRQEWETEAQTKPHASVSFWVIRCNQGVESRPLAFLGTFRQPEQSGAAVQPVPCSMHYAFRIVLRHPFLRQRINRGTRGGLSATGETKADRGAVWARVGFGLWRRCGRSGRHPSPGRRSIRLQSVPATWSRLNCQPGAGLG